MRLNNRIVDEDLEVICRDKILLEGEGKTYLITGANGFLGRYLVWVLLYLNDRVYKKPCKVFALVRNGEHGKRIFESITGRQDFHMIVQDVCEPEYNIKENIDYIIHAASQASPKYYGVDPVGTLEANTIGTYNLLKTAVKNNVSGFLFISSGEVYGITKYIPTEENKYGYIDINDVRNCYSESKRMGEIMCISFYKQFGIPVKIVRPFHTYGPGVALNDGRVFSDFVNNIVHGQDIKLNSDGTAIRSFCYVTDAILAFFYVLFHGNVGEAYNVGNKEQTISMKELAKLLVNMYEELGLKAVFNANTSSDGYLQSKINVNCPETIKIENLGWKPEIDIKTGFRRMIESYH